MKILLVGKPWKGGLINYLYSALDSLAPGNVEWLTTYPTTLSDKLSYRQNPEKWTAGLVEKITKTSYDIALFINTLEVFKDLSFSENNILWLTDDPRLTVPFLEPFGRVFISDPGYGSEFVSLCGADRYAGVSPFGFLPTPNFAITPRRDSRSKGLCFIGNKDPKRIPLIESLLDDGVDLTVYGNCFLAAGPFWKHPLNFRPPVPFEKMGKVYNRFKASLNIHARVVREGTNMRTFECAGYGIPQIVEARPKLEELFIPEEEILMFNCKDELLSQVDRLLHDEHLGTRLASNARRRVLAEHTYQHRVRTLLGDFLPT